MHNKLIIYPGVHACFLIQYSTHRLNVDLVGTGFAAVWTLLFGIYFTVVGLGYLGFLCIYVCILRLCANRTLRDRKLKC